MRLIDRKTSPMKARWELWAALAVVASSLLTIAATLNDIW